MKILLLKPDAIGDDVLITPVITALKNKYPDSELVVMAEERALPIFENHPKVGRVIRDYLYKKERSFWSILKEIKKEKFDLVINYRDEGNYALLTLLSGAPLRVGDKSKILFGWIYNKGVFLPWKKLWSTHQVIINLLLLGKLSITEKNIDTEIYTNQIAKEKIEHLLKDKGITEKDLLIGIHPGTGSGNKAYYPEGYAKGAEELIKKTSAKIILLGGGEKDEKLGQIITEKCSLPIINLIGKTDILELIALIKKLKIYIGVDSGPMHIASALKVPIAFISPSKSIKPERWGPWNSKYLMIREAKKCPLEKCDPGTCQENYCIEAIDPGEVSNAVLKLLGSRV